MPLITVGIPAYKADHLSQAIASVLSQTFGDYELLISDDSPDGSVKAVVEQFRDPRIRLIEGPRRGLVPNSVHVWENAAADLLKFVYDDDFLLPFCLAELMAALSDDVQANYAFCFRHFVDEAGRITASPRTFEGDRPRRFDPGAVARWIVRNLRNPVGEPTSLLIRRSAFPGPRCLDTFAGRGIRHLIDVTFFMNASARGPCIGVPVIHAAFRRHAAQVTSAQSAPGFSLGFMEWELCLRGGVQSGLAQPAEALEALPRLDLFYGSFEAAFPELAHRRRKLPALQAALNARETQLVTPEFLADLRDADELIASR